MNPVLKRLGERLARIGALCQLALLSLPYYAHKLAGQPVKLSITNGEASIRSIQSTIHRQSALNDMVLMFLVPAAIGLLLIIVAVTLLQARRPWIFWFLCIYGALLLVSSVLMPLGIFFLIYALVKKDDFLRPQSTFKCQESD